jgi:uncharacterized protein
MRRVLVITAIVLVTIVAMLAFVWSLQGRLMYFPIAEVGTRAGDDTPFDTVSIATADGLQLSAWWFAPPSPAPATVLVFGGNAGNRSHRIPLADALRRHGLQVLLVEYRGYGGNPGQPSERGLAADSRAAYAYVASRPDVDTSRLVFFGESLGSAVAVTLASEHPPAALILRSPFGSLTDIGAHHYPFLPVRFLLRDRFASIERIARIHAPVLVIAGDNDRIVPLAHSRRLYAAAAEPKALTVIRDADHNDDELLAGDEMLEAIVGFINRHVLAGARP